MRMSDETKTKIQQTTLRLPSGLYRWLRQYAFDTERTQNDITVDALREYRERIEQEVGR